jgi:replicative DNA helicase
MKEELLKQPIATSYELAKALESTEESVFRIESGFPSMDRICNGFEAGELVIVTGPTGEGKTTLLLSITSHLAQKDIGTTWFTLEVTPRQFIKKITKASGKLPFFYLPSSTFEDIDPEALRLWEKEKGRKFEMIDWIERRILQSVDRGNKEGVPVRAIFIDHIHQIFSIAKVERNLSLELGDMVAKIKDIAVKNNLVIFLIAHSKDDPQGTNREPRKEDIRDSGLVVRLADTVIGVWRVPNGDSADTNRRKEIKEGDVASKIRVFKNRREGVLGHFIAQHKEHRLYEDEFLAFD